MQETYYIFCICFNYLKEKHRSIINIYIYIYLVSRPIVHIAKIRCCEVDLNTLLVNKPISSTNIHIST